MNLSLKLVMKIQQKLDLSQQQKIELTQALSMKIVSLLNDIQQEVVGDVNDLFQLVVEKMLNLVKNRDMREGLRGIWSNSDFQEQILKRRSDLVAGNTTMSMENAANLVALDMMYKMSNGVFTYQQQSRDNKSDSPDVFNIEPDLMYLRQSLMEPDIFAREKSHAKKTLETSVTDQVKESFTQLLVKMTNAEIAAKILFPNIEALTTGILAGLSVRGKDNKALLRNFLLEYLILEKFNLEISDRLIKRFVAKFLPVRGHHKPERFSNAFCNIIGELVLVGMGVLDTKIFCRQKMNIGDDGFEWVCLANGMQKSELAKLLDMLNLECTGVIHWNRWNVKGQKASIKTDNQIRDFITKDIRMRSKEILKVLEFEEMFDQVMENNMELVAKDRKSGLEQIFLNKIENNDFQLKLRQMIKDHWYPAMKRKFYL